MVVFVRHKIWNKNIDYIPFHGNGHRKMSNSIDNN